MGMREKERRGWGGGGYERQARKRTGWRVHIESETQVCWLTFVLAIDVHENALTALPRTPVFEGFTSRQLGLSLTLTLGVPVDTAFMAMDTSELPRQGVNLSANHVDFSSSVTPASPPVPTLRLRASERRWKCQRHNMNKLLQIIAIWASPCEKGHNANHCGFDIRSFNVIMPSTDLARSMTTFQFIRRYNSTVPNAIELFCTRIESLSFAVCNEWLFEIQCEFTATSSFYVTSSMPKAKFWRCQSCWGRSIKRCPYSTSRPITAKPQIDEHSCVIPLAHGQARDVLWCVRHARHLNCAS